VIWPVDDAPPFLYLKEMDESMRPLLKRTLLGLILAILALEGAYLVAANIYLNTDLAPKSINRNPEKFQLCWRSAWSLYPGMVVLYGAQVRGRSRRTEWYSGLDYVNARFELLPLRRRTVHLTGVNATGVEYRQRRRLLPGETSRAPLSELPPIPEFLDTPGGPRGLPDRARKPRRPWTVVADIIRCDMEELWIDRFRLDGALRVETGMNLVVRGPMEFPRVRLTMDSGELLAGEGTIFHALGLDIEATLHPFVPKGARGLGFFRYLSGRFDLRSESASLFFLEAYFRKTPWLRFNDRAGGRMQLRLDHGRMQPGSTLEILNDHLDMAFLDRHLTGKARITGTVEEIDGKAQSTVTAHLQDFQLAPEGSAQPFARGRTATLVGSSAAVDLSNPFTDLKVLFDLPQAEILNLAFYNSMIPPGSRFRLLSGTGTLRYHLEGSQEERSLHGTIDLAVKKAAARFENYEMRGDFTLKTLLRQSSPRELLFDVSGTRLDLHTDEPEWSAVITFPKADMRFSDPLKIDATVWLSMLDTRPLVVMYDALKGVPDWLEKMMIIENIHGGAKLDVRRDHVVVKDLDVTGKGLHALADLVLAKGSREGILYLRFHGFSLGIELQEGGRNLKIIRPLNWFQQERARRRPE